MGRTKKERLYTYKPHYKRFISQLQSNGLVNLNSDEIEAIYLIDYKNLYQEDAAKLMSISRPTLSRIIKDARSKIATALVCGYDINIKDEKMNFTIAICTNDKENPTSFLELKGLYIALVEVEEFTIQNITYLSNPLLDETIRPSQILPQFLEQHHCSYFVCGKIGMGLEASIINHGINYIETTTTISSFEEIVNKIVNLS